MVLKPADDGQAKRRSRPALRAARSYQWDGTSRRFKRRHSRLLIGLAAVIVAELTYLVIAGAQPDRANEARIGPLDDPNGFELFETGRTTLSAPVQRARDMLAGAVRRAPDLLDEQQRIPWGLPVSLERGWVSSEFGPRQLEGQEEPTNHKGVDLAVDTGTPVHATARGVVVVSNPGYNGGYGKVIYIDHGNGIVSRYAHLSKLKVEVGHHVERGELIALSGATGHVTGAHLHYELRVNGEPVNPRDYMPDEDLPTTRPPGM
jgi:murein DD-endopeptidase MepM/ murein hydrolase activator NlpD